MSPHCALSLTYQASLISFPLKHYIAQGPGTSFLHYNLPQPGLTLSYVVHAPLPVPLFSCQRYKPGSWNSGVQVAPAFPSELSVSFTYTLLPNCIKRKIISSTLVIPKPNTPFYYMGTDCPTFYILVIVH